MTSRKDIELERNRLRELSKLLRDATYDAMMRGSPLTTALDEARCEVERLLMLDAIDPDERRRIVTRAQMMLDAWRGMAGGSPASGGGSSAGAR